MEFCKKGRYRFSLKSALEGRRERGKEIENEPVREIDVEREKDIKSTREREEKREEIYMEVLTGA